MRNDSSENTFEGSIWKRESDEGVIFNELACGRNHFKIIGE